MRRIWIQMMYLNLEEIGNVEESHMLGILWMVIFLEIYFHFSLSNGNHV